MLSVSNNTDGIGANYTIEDITPQGHEFLGNTRNKENWVKTKEIAEKAENFTLSALGQIASGVASTAINKLFGF